MLKSRAECSLLQPLKEKPSMLRRFTMALLLFATPIVVLGDEPAEAGAAVAAAIQAGPEDATEKDRPGAIDEDAPQEFQTTASGLKYRILRKSDQDKPKASDAVEVHYKGWLDDKTIFDSSYQRGEKISFPLSRVIPGWTEGMQLVGEGGMIELEIPGKLGYGARGTRGIPPNATLHFVVELFEIK
jgi:FKBP-type peptidyl-prolyl cis-trans isomerase FkpA